jgi:hypothetical protein
MIILFTIRILALASGLLHAFQLANLFRKPDVQKLTSTKFHLNYSLLISFQNRSKTETLHNIKRLKVYLE